MGAFYLDIKKDLLDKILSGVYQQGSIIPNEYELAEIYNVSRPTIRKAVQILVDEGYLEKRKKRGTIVCDPTIRQEFVILADETCADLLDVKNGDPLFYFHSTGYDESHTAIEYSIAKYRGDRNSFVFQLSNNVYYS